MIRKTAYCLASISMLVLGLGFLVQSSGTSQFVFADSDHFRLVYRLERGLLGTTQYLSLIDRLGRTKPIQVNDVLDDDLINMCAQVLRSVDKKKYFVVFGTRKYEVDFSKPSLEQLDNRSDGEEIEAIATMYANVVSDDDRIRYKLGQNYIGHSCSSERLSYLEF